MESLLSAIDFLTRYQCVIFMALCCFIPLLKRRRGMTGLLIFTALGIAYCAVPWVYTSITGKFFWMLPVFQITKAYYAGFLLYWLAALALFHLFFQCSVRNVLFYGAAAYSVQWFSVNAQAVVRQMVFGGQRTPAYWVAALFVEALILMGFYLIFVRRLREDDGVNINNLQLIVFLMLTLFSVNVFTQYWQTAYIAAGNIDTVEIYGSVFSLLIALLLLVVQFGLFEHIKLRQANAVMEQMLKTAEKQYELSRQNIEVINRKCHDMRYQIRALSAVTDEMQRQALFSEAEQAIQIYGSISKTGNEALDVVLTEKNLLCEKNKISFSYILNGEDFSFINAVDLYSLFGNILDNAIESVVKCPEEERRIIILREQRRGNFVNLTVENYCGEELAFSDGLPVTTKEDRGRHGFGTKSIRYIVEKYGGHVTMEKSVDRFTLRAYFTA